MKHLSYEAALLQFFQPPANSLPLRSKYSPSILFSYILSLYAFLSVDQVSHPCKTAGRIVSLYILIFTFLQRRWETRDSE